MRGTRAATVGAFAAIAGFAIAGAASSKTPDPATAHLQFVIDGLSIARRFPHGQSIAFSYPANWHVTTRRLDNVIDPHTLFAVSSYTLNLRSRDDCDGTRARSRPNDGVFVLLKEVLDQASLRRSLPRLPRKPTHFRLPTAGRAGCLLPPSVAYQFRVGKRAFYLWISVGARASARTRAALSTLLDGMAIARYPQP